MVRFTDFSIDLENEHLDVSDVDELYIEYEGYVHVEG